MLPSEQESFGLAALESMSCGVPVIATRAGGLREVVEDGKTGFTFSVGDTEAMAQCAVRILGQKDLLRSLGIAARKRAEDRFPRERVVDLYEGYYREILSAPIHKFW
jgi:glycosyltransferase involved in cell wall biosynthesis